MKYLIIGGSKGIGRALVDKLLGEGHQVMVAARSSGDLPLDGIEFQEYDVTLDQELVLNHTELDGIAYLPGSINLKPFHRLKPQEFDQDLRINLLGAVRVFQQCLPALKKSDMASVLMFSTVAVNQGMPYHSSVAAAKAAVEGLGRSLAAEWAPKIRVNIIAPSLIDTDLASRLLSTEERREASAQRHPLKKIGAAEDVAALAAFLLSGDSKWITGQVFGVDGGISTLRTG